MDDVTATAGPLLLEQLGYFGRMLSGSKLHYRDNHPDDTVVFNSNVVSVKRTSKRFGRTTQSEPVKIWYGDINVTKDGNILQQVADETGETLYVLYEMDGRFDNEFSPRIDRAVATFTPEMQ